MANAGEEIEHFALRWRSVGRSIRREKCELQLTRQGYDCLIARFFTAGKVALELYVYIAAPENAAQLLQAFFRAGSSAGRESMRQQSFLAASDADEAAAHRRDFFRKNAAFAFGRAQFHLRNQAAQILISRA